MPVVARSRFCSVPAFLVFSNFGAASKRSFVFGKCTTMTLRYG